MWGACLLSFPPPPPPPPHFVQFLVKTLHKHAYIPATVHMYNVSVCFIHHKLTFCGFFTGGHCTHNIMTTYFIQGTFYTFDADRSGTVEPHELQNALRTFGYNLSPQAQGAILRHFSTDGKISFDSFVACCVKLRVLTSEYSACLTTHQHIRCMRVYRCFFHGIVDLYLADVLNTFFPCTCILISKDAFMHIYV